MSSVTLHDPHNLSELQCPLLYSRNHKGAYFSHGSCKSEMEVFKIVTSSDSPFSVHLSPQNLLSPDKPSILLILSASHFQRASPPGQEFCLFC